MNTDDRESAEKQSFYLFIHFVYVLALSCFKERFCLLFPRCFFFLFIYRWQWRFLLWGGNGKRDKFSVAHNLPHFLAEAWCYKIRVCVCVCDSGYQLAIAFPRSTKTTRTFKLSVPSKSRVDFFHSKTNAEADTQTQKGKRWGKVNCQLSKMYFERMIC